MINRIILFFLLFFTLPVFPQEFRFPVKNYGPGDYGSGLNSQNPAIAVTKQGHIIAGNSGGILKFDGNAWQFIPVKEGMWVTALSVNPNGIIFAGMNGEFGKLVPDSMGKLKYVSLSGILKEKDRNFTTIWRVFCTGGLTFFQAEEAIFVYDGNVLKTIKPETSFHLAFQVDNNIYVRQRGKGLLKVLPDGLTGCDLHGKFSETGIFGIVKQPDTGNVIIITRENGLYSGSFSDNLSSVKKIDSDEETLDNARINGAIRLNDGNVALYTLQNGVIIIDNAGKIQHIINKNSGLRDNEVKSAVTDNRGRIWVAMNNGIACINYPSLLSRYSDSEGVTGNVNAIIRHNNILYIATSSGLYYSGNKYTPFVKFSGINFPVWSFATYKNSLFAGTDEGIYEINNNVKKITEAASICLYTDTVKSLLYSGNSDGLRVYGINSGFSLLSKLESINNLTVTGIAPAVLRSNEVWAGTMHSGVYRFSFDTLASYTYEEGDGLPQSWVIPVTYKNTALFLTNKGIFRFIDEETIKAGLPDNLKNDPVNYRGYFEPVDFNNLPSGLPAYCFAEDKKGFWFSLDNRIFHYNNATSRLDGGHFSKIRMGKINSVFCEEDNIWFGCDDGVLRFDEKRKFDSNTPVTCFAGPVYSGDSLIYGGAGYFSDNYIGFTQTGVNIPVLDYLHNSLSIDFSSDELFETEYSFRLHPVDTAWSKWNSSPTASYNYLPEGKYTFELQAKNKYNSKSGIVKWDFVILPPWYRTKIAYAGYATGLILLIYLLVRLNTRRLRAKNKKLEKIVYERTAEIREKNVLLQEQNVEIQEQRDELGRQNVEILHQKKEITDSITYARRIQSAAIPDAANIPAKLKDYFIFYLPRDIVSGDFYWFGKIDNKVLVIAADCTGHGVPGAFMSMLGIAFLNEIINKEKISSPAQILNNLRANVIKSLKQGNHNGGKEKNKDSELNLTNLKEVPSQISSASAVIIPAKTDVKDGMDITVVSIDFDNKILAFSGANNPLYITRKTENYSENDFGIIKNKISITGLPEAKAPDTQGYVLIEVKGDKMPVAIHTSMESFSETEIAFKEGDAFYIFSDGFADQFGGPKGKKFMSKNLKELLVKISRNPMKMQKTEIEEQFNSWKQSYEQVDDVLMIGVRL